MLLIVIPVYDQPFYKDGLLGWVNSLQIKHDSYHAYTLRFK